MTPLGYSLQLPLQMAFSNWNVVCPYSSSDFNCCLKQNKKNPLWVFSTNSEADLGPHVSHVGSWASCFEGPYHWSPKTLLRPSSNALAPSCFRKIKDLIFPIPFTQHQLWKTHLFCHPFPFTPQTHKPQWPGTFLSQMGTNSGSKG